jgi:hypothetical protein
MREISMAKGNPFTKKAFEKSKFDVEKKGEKEGSKADKARDAKQFAKFKKGRK